jgi:hypothetical protein
MAPGVPLLAGALTVGLMNEPLAFEPAAPLGFAVLAWFGAWDAPVLRSPSSWLALHAQSADASARIAVVVLIGTPRSAGEIRRAPTP